MPLSDAPRLAEDAYHRTLIPRLKAHGWRPRLIPYDGYGTAAAEPASSTGPSTSSAAGTGSAAGLAIPGSSASKSAGSAVASSAATSSSMVRIMARLVMRPKDAPSEGPLFCHVPKRPPHSPQELQTLAMDSLMDAQRGWRQFIDAPVPFLPVTIEIGERRLRTRADRGGYLDVVIRDHGLEPGWHKIRIQAAGAGTVHTNVRITPPGPRLGIICDIDDTTMVTDVPRPFIAAWNLLMRDARNRVPVPGMPELLTQISEAHEGPLVFLSTGAWNVVPTLQTFFAENGVPRAPMLMTDWGPTNTGWFRSGVEHKRTELRRLLLDFPEVTWLLIGDDGQNDPLVYSEISRAHRNRVAAVAIRQLSPREQVLAGSPLSNPMALGPQARTLAESGVAPIYGRDGYELLDRLPAWITRA